MPDYQKMYTTLFSAVTDVIHILQRAQQNAEALFIEDSEPAREADDEPTR